MKKFSFSLQKVLEIKEQILENYKIELSSLNSSLISLDLDIKNLNEQFFNINKEFIEKSSNSISVGEMAYYKLLMSSILRQIDNKKESKKIIQKKIEAKRQEIIVVNQEISSLDKLKEKELEKYNQAVMRSEEIFIEEFVSNKSMRNEFAI